MASTLSFLLPLLLVSLASASHYFGGTVTFAYKGKNPDGTHRVDIRNRDTFDGCQSSHYWSCNQGNCGNNIRTQRGVIDRSTNAPQYNNQWCETETVITKRLWSDKPFKERAASCCWIPKRHGNSQWRLLTHLDLGTRSDTGKPNRSPDIAILPFLRVPQNCPRTYNLMSFDPDGDQVRCRYGTPGSSECSSCHQPSGFHLDQDSCTLHYHNASADPRVFGFELVVEDFPRGYINLAYSDGSRSARAPLPSRRRKRQASTYPPPTTASSSNWWWWVATSAPTPTTPFTTFPWWWYTTTTPPAPTTTTPFTTTPGWWWWHTTTTSAPTTTTPFTTTPSWWWWHTTTTSAPTTTTTWPSTTTAPSTTTPGWWWWHTTTTSAPTTTTPFTTTPSWWWWHTTTTSAPTTTTTWPSTTTAPSTTTPSWWWWHTTTTSAPTTTTTSAPTTTTPFTTTPSWWWWHTTTTSAPTTTTTSAPTTTTTSAPTTTTTSAPTTTTPFTTTPSWWWWHTTTTSAPTTTTTSAPTTTAPSTTTSAPTTTAPSTTTWPSTTTAPSTTTPWWHSTTTTTARTYTTTGQLSATTAPLSKLPLQFSLLVDPPAPSCQEGLYLPKFVQPTPENGARIYAEINKEMEIRVKAQATYATIHGIIISGPQNISKHTTTHGEFVIRWTPLADDLGDYHPICFAVEATAWPAATTGYTTHNHNHHANPTSQSGIYQSEMRCVLVNVKTKKVNAHVVCGESTMTVHVEKSSITGLHEDHLQLSDPSNTACSLQTHSNSTHIIAVVPLNACGTQIEEDDDNLLFKNEITTVDNNRDLITRKHLLEVQFYCQYPKRGNVTLGFTAHRENITVWEKAFGTFTYEFEFYPDNQYQSSIDPDSYPLEYDIGSRIYMQIEATSSVNNTELFIDSCRAAPYDNPNYHPTYSIIENGCKVDPTLEIYTPAHEKQFRFSIEAFKFIGLHDQVYISCSVLMCEAGAPNTRCSQGCINSTWPSGHHQHHHRRRREAVIQTANHFVSQGPLRLRRSAESTGATVTNLNLNLVFIAGCLLAAVGMLCGAVIYKTKMSKVKYQPLSTVES